MIAVVDFGSGNLTSVRHALRAVGAESGVVSSADGLAGATGIVLPGVGHFEATRRLDESWRAALRRATDAGTPLLGICLGMQWLFEGSDEAPGTAGLGVCAGRIARLPDAGTGGARLKVPHVGWSRVASVPGPNAMPGLRDGAHYYFTHSFAAPVTGDTTAVAEYGTPFAAAIRRGGVWGVQFHPERSGADGLALLGAWASRLPRNLSRRDCSPSPETISPGEVAKRLIACLDVRDGRVVKGVRFQDLRDSGDPAELAARYGDELIDELVVLDVTATLESRLALRETVAAVAARVFIPLAVGGGIRSLEDAAAVIDAGADKVSVNSAALEDPGLITRIADRFGSQAVVVAIDARRAAGRFVVHARAGRDATSRDAVAWAAEAERRGAGEILLTSIDADGTQQGFDCPLTAAVSDAVGIPVIASGGAGAPEHFTEVFSSGRADAALAASIFHDRVHAVRAIKRHLLERGVPVRL